MTHTSLTEYVAQWAVDMDLADVPDPVKATAKRHMLDGYGLALSGHAEESHAILAGHAARSAGNTEVHILGSETRIPAETAALVNGLSMHAMDFDDTQLATDPESVYGLLTHPTTPALGAASAAGELAHASGSDLLAAFIAGVEVECRIADAVNPRHYQEGFHSTGTIGAFGAVTAAGRLLGLDADQMRTAFGIAAPLGGGYRENFGTMTKPLHAGQAAAAGVLAARLAKDGFTAAPTILEAKRGFFNAAAGGYDPARIGGRLGKPFFFESPGVSIKPYPSWSLSHPGQDAVLELVNEHDVDPALVKSATAYTNSAMPNALIYAMPQTSLEAKFSFPFFLAIAILRRKVGIAEFTDEVVLSPEVQEMMKRCHHVADPAITALGFHTMETRIEIELTDGTVLSKTNSVATGHPDKPMSDEQLHAKFIECATLAIDSEAAERAAATIAEIESLDDVADLHSTLAGEAVATAGRAA
jgi:2-methylcitrate dehydratase PrpD